jgi:predicted kinase
MTSRDFVILVTGSTGAGKTSYAIDVAKRLGGVRFSIDDWMTTLFWMDSPDPIEFEWTMARIGRCEAQMLEQVAALSALGIPSILDLGFTRTDHRARFAAAVGGMGAEISLHWVDVPTEERWRRVEQRNTEKGETFAMTVDRAMFDFMEGQWQPPSDEEMNAMNGQVIR